MIGHLLGKAACIAIISAGAFVTLFCLACAASARRNGEAPGFFVIGAIFCLFLLGVVFLVLIAVA